MNRPQKRHPLRTFGVVFSFTVCLLMAGAGFAIADYNTRSSGVGNDAAALEAQAPLNEPLKENDPGPADAAKTAAEGLWAFLPPSWKASIWMVEGEIRLACETIAALFS